MLRDQDVIQSEKVYKLCWDINPHHFSAKPKEAEPGKRRAYEGFAEEEASYTAEEWAEAMVIFIGIMEQFSSVRKKDPIFFGPFDSHSLCDSLHFPCVGIVFETWNEGFGYW